MSSNIFDLSNKTVVITGASSGFGHHFSAVLAEAGATVVLGARRKEKIQENADEINKNGGKAIALHLDVNDADSVIQFLDDAESFCGNIDVLINNAGVEAGAKTFMTIDEEDWDYVFNTNLKAVWRLSKFFTERVAKSRVTNKTRTASIINIASITAFRTIKGQFPYAVSKAALVKATEIMALEGAKFGVRVNALAPGYFLTDVSRILLESEMSESFKQGIPMRRFGQFPDLDGPIMLLASDASSYMTGSTIVVDGGHICAEL
ncbi:MAG: NAD(P)-dependent dehydrogenase (short-subunit alcohol dehydrogenase family) [Candidatus Azotimanducaceae bacterium]|jgi:NAD(P)-dependent dehydrogenase (short-subunit alcohol dehydrogenase family)